MVWAHAIPKPSSGRWLKELPAIDLNDAPAPSSAEAPLAARPGCLGCVVDCAAVSHQASGQGALDDRCLLRAAARHGKLHQPRDDAPPGRLHPCTPLRRPDPAPATFGYHEVFHLLVIAGVVAAHFLAIGLYALPTG